MNSMPTLTALVASLLLGSATLAARAQTAPPASGGQMSGMEQRTTTPGTTGSPSSQAFTAANEKMMKNMSVPLTGDTDWDFVAGMIPHHQGAIDMAEVELKYGRDPEMKKLARDIIAAQKKEIAVMTRWQQKHGAAAAAR
jgi:uncharacterized protein (DUF305 family)